MSDVLPFYSPIFYPAPSECLPVAQIEVNSLVCGAREPLSCAGASETEVIPSDPTFHNFISHNPFLLWDNAIGAAAHFVSSNLLW